MSSSSCMSWRTSWALRGTSNMACLIAHSWRGVLRMQRRAIRQRIMLIAGRYLRWVSAAIWRVNGRRFADMTMISCVGRVEPAHVGFRLDWRRFRRERAEVYAELGGG
ncbi:uncharacterized protein CC84DRAFT_743505 [Paraphaeosphaeria sporulosa]|uniref:Uncharacterized protein n=1 Tax=Paraphaeosphaeria sporulosa TaxID=1460663 RepID=A0A177CGQ2_9PLEO|nr:uncharacterized protein CC84DRAFT_743505 [Paraphaeosphaeria sporulosa]OAG06019.1 hypothetical protein CC84DRAFT_743505 [Paraphaeosphaeria sporulosa]